MKTKSGRELAQSRSELTIKYFEDLISELKTYNIGDYHIRRFSHDSIEDILLLVPQKCSKCKGEYFIDLGTEQGIKCKKLLANFACNLCKDNYTISFCLPIIEEWIAILQRIYLTFDHIHSLDF